MADWVFLIMDIEFHGGSNRFTITVDSVGMIHKFNKLILIGWFQELMKGIVPGLDGDYYLFSNKHEKRLYTREDYQEILRRCLAHAMENHGY